MSKDNQPDNQPEIRKVRITDSLVSQLEELMKRHPGKFLNLTSTVNYVLDAAMPFVMQDLDELGDRLRQKQREHRSDQPG